MSELANATPVPAVPMPTPSSTPDTQLPEPTPETLVTPEAPVTPDVPATTPETPVIPETVPAEPATPETPAEPDPTELPNIAADEDGGVFESTGNEYLDSALQQMVDGGVDLEQAFTGMDGDNIQPNMDYLNEKLGKAAAHGLIEGIKAENAKMEEWVKTETNALYESVGGEAAWKGITEWIGKGESGLTPEARTEYNQMLSQGGIQAQLAAQALNNMYRQSPGFSEPQPLTTGDATAQPTGIEPISRLAYSEALSKLGTDVGPEADALHARRLHTMKNGG